MRSYTSKGRQIEETARPEFEIDGEVFRGQGTLSLMDLSEFARLAASGFDSGSPEGIGILADIYRSVLGDEEFQRFRRHCRDNGTDGKVLVEILGGLMSEAGDRPTSRPSDSPDGPPAAPATSKVVSFSRATVQEVPVEQAPQPETQPVPTPAIVSYG